MIYKSRWDALWSWMAGLQILTSASTWQLANDGVYSSTACNIQVRRQNFIFSSGCFWLRPVICMVEIAEMVNESDRIGMSPFPCLWNHSPRRVLRTSWCGMATSPVAASCHFPYTQSSVSSVYPASVPFKFGRSSRPHFFLYAGSCRMHQMSIPKDSQVGGFVVVEDDLDALLEVYFLLLCSMLSANFSFSLSFLTVSLHGDKEKNVAPLL